MKKNRRQLDLDLPRSPRKQKVFTTPSSWIQKWWLTKFKKNKKENPPLCNANAPIPSERVWMLSLIRMIGNGRYFNSWDHLIPPFNLTTTNSNPFPVMNNKPTWRKSSRIALRFACRQTREIGLNRLSFVIHPPIWKRVSFNYAFKAKKLNLSLNRKRRSEEE